MLVLVKSNGRKRLKFDKSLIGGFFSAIQTFNLSLYSQEIEILSGKNYCIIFYFQDLALESLYNSSRDFKQTKDKDVLLSYAVIKNCRKNIENYARKNVLPLLKKVLTRFKCEYHGCNFNITSQFIEFKEILIKEFGVE